MIITVLGYWMAAVLLAYAIGITIGVVQGMVAHYRKGKR